MFKWGRYHSTGYEISTIGDHRFSALNAKLKDKRTIEMHYQCDTKLYQPGGTNWKLGKGKPPLDKTVNLWEEYLKLWKTWSKENPILIEELYHNASKCDYTLTDNFASSPVNQARALATILNEKYFSEELNHGTESERLRTTVETTV